MRDRLPTPTTEAGLFWRLRWTLVRTLVRHALQQARLRTFIIVLLTALFWCIMYALFRDGFRLIVQTVTHEGTRVQIAHAVFNVFFLALSAMLTVSAGIILYSTLYRSSESRFLLTLPIRIRRIVLYKFQETVFVACWGFFLLGSPLLLAYGKTMEAPFSYYLMLPVFMLGFATIPCACGAIICMALVRFAPKFQRAILIAFGGAALVTLIAVAWVLLREATPANMMTIDWFQTMLGRLQYSEQPFLPSWWLSTGLLESAHPANDGNRSSVYESLGFLSVLTSTALCMYLLVGDIAQRTYVQGLSAVAGLPSAKKSASMSWLDRTMHGLLWLLPISMRQLLIKDFRIFRRDTMQWSQLAIFLTLLLFYFLNIRRLHDGQSNQTWLAMISFLNVAVVGLLLATFTTRFIYPLISLEGRRFWVLGTLPISRAAVLWSKFLFAVFISLVPCCGLILLSDSMLGVTMRYPQVALMHQATCFTLCTGLSAIATGLGALFPNLREPSPAKIASGFGGTLTLVISAGFILATVMLTAAPSFVAVGIVNGRIRPSWWHPAYVLLGFSLAMIVGAVATVVPLWLGNRTFKRLEL